MSSDDFVFNWQDWDSQSVAGLKHFDCGQGRHVGHLHKFFRRDIVSIGTNFSFLRSNIDMRMITGIFRHRWKLNGNIKLLVLIFRGSSNETPRWFNQYTVCHTKIGRLRG